MITCHEEGEEVAYVACVIGARLRFFVREDKSEKLDTRGFPTRSRASFSGSPAPEIALTPFWMRRELIDERRQASLLTLPTVN